MNAKLTNQIVLVKLTTIFSQHLLLLLLLTFIDLEMFQETKVYCKTNKLNTAINYNKENFNRSLRSQIKKTSSMNISSNICLWITNS
jgi:hypothetical protein